MLLKSYLISVVVIILLLSLVLSACSSSTSSSPIAPASSASASPSQPTAAKPAPMVIKLVTFLPVTNVDVACIKPFAADVEKRSNGRLTIDWRGGPEVMPPLRN